MKKGKNIHNLVTLEREIYRLKLEARTGEDKLDHNWEQLQKNFPQLLLNSLSCRNKYKENGKESFFRSALRNEKLNGFIDKIADRLSDRAAEGVEHFFDRLFRKKK